MKVRKFFSIAASCAMIATSVAVSGGSAQAESKYSFICKDNSNGVPTTFAVRNGEESQFINWRSDAFTLAGYPPKVRCNQVSNRMTQYIAAGYPRYITHGIDKDTQLPIICVTSIKGGGCEGLLYTLKPGQPAKETLKDLLELNRRNFKSYPLVEAPSCRHYVEIDALIAGKLKRADVVCTNKK